MAASITLPPPIAMITSPENILNISATLLISSNVGSGLILS